MDNGLRTTDNGQRTTDYGLRTTDCGLRITDYETTSQRDYKWLPHHTR